MKYIFFSLLSICTSILDACTPTDYKTAVSIDSNGCIITQKNNMYIGAISITGTDKYMKAYGFECYLENKLVGRFCLEQIATDCSGQVDFHKDGVYIIESFIEIPTGHLDISFKVKKEKRVYLLLEQTSVTHRLY